jgi:hypothetical protein
VSFGRNPVADRERRQQEREANMRVLCAPSRALSRGTYEGGTSGEAVEKTPRYVDQALTDAAQGRVCLLMVPAVCNHRTDTTVACHSNWSEHGGKGGHRKADDTYSVWGCHACHYWLDFGKASEGAKRDAFMTAHARQVLAWRLIALDPSEPPRFRRAAQRALEFLGATPIGAIA